MQNQANPEDFDHPSHALLNDRRKFFLYALKFLNDQNDAEEVIQDTYLRLIDHLSQEVKCSTAWVFRIIRNLCLDRLRKRRRSTDAFSEQTIREYLHGDVKSSYSPEQHLMISRSLHNVANEIEMMPSAEAETMMMVVINGMSYEEVANIFNVPIGTVRSRLNRARQRLRKCLGDHCSA